MIRSDVIRALQAYLTEAYDGPVSILTSENDADLAPPYAVIRTGSGEDIGGGQYDLWQFTIIVAVFHDADATAAEDAEAAAEEVFAEIQDPADIVTSLASAGLIVSAWELVSTEASIVETRWQHIGGFNLVVAPALPD